MAITLVKKPGTPAQPVAPRSLRLLSVKDAAAYGQVSSQTVRRLIKAGGLKTYRVGRQIRIDEADLIASITPQRSSTGRGFFVRGDHHDSGARGDAIVATQI